MNLCRLSEWSHDLWQSTAKEQYLISDRNTCRYMTVHVLVRAGHKMGGVWLTVAGDYSWGQAHRDKNRTGGCLALLQLLWEGGRERGEQGRKGGEGGRKEGRGGEGWSCIMAVLILYNNFDNLPFLLMSSSVSLVRLAMFDGILMRSFSLNVSLRKLDIRNSFYSASKREGDR